MDLNLAPSKDGLLEEISAIIKLDTTDGFISTIVQHDTVEGRLIVDYNKKVYSDLLEMMQYLEASLSFTVGVKKIYWEEPEVIFIPENEEERLKYDVTSFRANRQWPLEEIRKLTKELLTDIFQNKNNYRHLIPIQLFFKEGVRELNDFRFVNAYYNFYFILEDLYGKGKTNNTQVENNFKSSQLLCGIIQNVIDNVLKEKHIKDIKEFLAEEKLDFNMDGIIKLIVQVRGNIHHFSSKSTKRKGTPLNQRDFESMAYLLFGISNSSIIQAMKQAVEKKR